MPIESQLIDPEIFVFNWVGVVKANEVLKKTEEAANQFSDESPDKEVFVSIINMERMERLPLNTLALRETFDVAPMMCGVVVVHGNSVAQILARSLNAMLQGLNRPIVFVDDMGDAENKAREILQNRVN